MAYDNAVLKTLRERWEHPDRHTEHIVDYADEHHDLTRRQVYNRLRSLAPDRNTLSVDDITGRGHTLTDNEHTRAFPDCEEHAIAQTLQSINIEPKQALLLTGTQRRSSSQHYKALDQIVNDAHLPHRSTFRDYTTILHDTGMLTEYQLGREVGVNRTEYKRSPTGDSIGAPAAAGALDYAIQHGRSLYDIIGQVAHAGETNGLHTRIQILETIQGHDRDTSVADVVTDVDADRGTIDKHILHLRDKNVINHPSAETKEKRYQLTTNTIDDDLEEPFDKNEYVTATILSDENNISVSYAKQRLQTLQQQGKLTSPSGKHRSKLTLTGTGHAFTQYVDELRGLINDDDRADKLKHIQDVLESNQDKRYDHLRRGFELHAEASSNTDDHGRTERLKQIASTVGDQQSPSTQDIAQATQLSRQMTSTYLRRLKENNIVETIRDSNGAQKQYRRTDKPVDTI